MKHKIYLWIVFIFSILFVAFYQYVLIDISSSKFNYKSGVLVYNICCSIIAASIFYLITQHLFIDLPKARKEVKAISVIHHYILCIDEIVEQLKIDIRYENGNIEDLDKLGAVLIQIDVNASIHEFQNWFQYFYSKKLQISELIISSFYFHEYLDDVLVQELLILHQRLMNVNLFSGYKILANDDLSFADLTIQEIFIHNKILQNLRKKEVEFYKVKLEKEGKRYRDKNYN